RVARFATTNFALAKLFAINVVFELFFSQSCKPKYGLIMPANKGNETTAEASTGSNAAEPVERRAGAKGNAHALDSEPGSRVTGAGAYTASNCRHTPEVEPYA